MHNMKLLIPYAARYKLRTFLGVVVIALATIFSLLQPYYLKEGINTITAHYSAHGPNIPSLASLGKYVLLFIAAAAGQSICAFFQRSSINRVSRYMEYDLRQDLFLHLQSSTSRSIRRCIPAT